MSRIFRGLILTGVVLCGSISTYAQQVEVMLSNIRNSKGSIRVGIFRDNETFQDKNAWKNVAYSKKTVKGGAMKITLDLPPGTYGISLLDDENNNKEMDYNMIHIPKEGFGFSDYYHKGLTMPDFEDFDFTVKAGTPTKVKVKMKYM